MSVAPRLSVVLVTPDRLDHHRTTLRHLRAQSIADTIEIVVVAPSTERAALDAAALDGFHGHRVVEIGRLRSNAHGLAAGVRAATAPVVAFGEDHCFPAPGWAAALVDAHADGHAVVGPVFRLANPATAVSVADFVMTYGPWLDPAPAGERAHLPGHNSAYEREILLRYDEDLEHWLEAESVLHWALRSAGHTLYLEPAAAVYHFNFSRLEPLLAASFHLARAFAGNRFDGGAGSVARRVVYALGSPLLPAIRLPRLLGDLARLEIEPPRWRVAAALLAALVASAIGEALGYALGPGDAARRISTYEFERSRHMITADQALLEAARFYE